MITSTVFAPASSRAAALALLATGLLGAPAHAQQTTMPSMKMAAPADTARPKKPMEHMPDMDHAGMNMSSGTDSPTMSAATSRNLPMSRNGSATSWQPDATPMYMWMTHRGP